MAFDDMTALGAVRALSKAGIKVPVLCSVIGFDVVADSSLLTPPLTTIRQPMAEMGKMAVNIVSEGIAAVQGKQKIVAHHPEAYAGTGHSRLHVRDQSTVGKRYY